MKLSDLLIDYCEIDGVRIIRVLNQKLFFAVKVNDMTIELHYLYEEEVSVLQNNLILIPELFSAKRTWRPIEECEYLLSQKMYRLLMLNSHDQITSHKKEKLSEIDAATVRWFEINAEAGDPTAMFCLSNLYRDGRGFEQNSKTAEYWLSKATASGLSQEEISDGKGPISTVEENWDLPDFNPFKLILTSARRLWIKNRYKKALKAQGLDASYLEVHDTIPCNDDVAYNADAPIDTWKDLLAMNTTSPKSAVYLSDHTAKNEVSDSY